MYVCNLGRYDTGLYPSELELERNFNIQPSTLHGCLFVCLGRVTIVLLVLLEYITLYI